MDKYYNQAVEFLRKSGTDCEIKEVRVVFGFPWETEKDNRHPHVKYAVVLRREKKTYDFPFYDSTWNFQHNQRPTCYDVLACLQKYPVEADVWDFAREFGYEIRDRKSYNRVLKIHQECIDQYEALLDLFGPDLMAELEEIN